MCTASRIFAQIERSSSGKDARHCWLEVEWYSRSILKFDREVIRLTYHQIYIFSALSHVDMSTDAASHKQ